MKKQVFCLLPSLWLLTACSGSAPMLGVHQQLLQACPDSPNCVISQAANDGNYIQPLVYQGTMLQAQQRLLQILKAEKRSHIVTQQTNYLRVEFHSALFGFVDDLEFYLLAQQNEQILIHVRSAARLGYYDFGVNRQRIEHIRRELSNQTK
ncbi:DUF1499 domain-containing protein [Agarivorans sp. Z349TD_8]|uniref:DUF1499 domain-containing protein n=2 Tax=unclassified Agarivorans TaxID=2636026 RepID=UPI003D7D49DE